MLIYLRVNNNNFVGPFLGAAQQSEGDSKRTGLFHLGFFVMDLQGTLRTLVRFKFGVFPGKMGAFKEPEQVRTEDTLLYFVQDPNWQCHGAESDYS